MVRIGCVPHTEVHGTTLTGVQLHLCATCVLKHVCKQFLYARKTERKFISLTDHPTQRSEADIEHVVPEAVNI